MDIANIVILALNGLLGLCVLVGFLWGIKRGFKKSIIRFSFVAVALIISFFIAGPITSALMTMDISSLVNLEVAGETCKNLNEYILATLNANPEIADLIRDSETMKSLILQIPVVIVQAILFGLLFWILKIITWPIFAICAKNVYKKKVFKQTITQENTKDDAKKKLTKKEIKTQAKASQLPKRRMLGGLVGVAQGLMIVFVSLLPIGGTIGLIKELDKTPNTNTVSALSENTTPSSASQTVLQYLLNQATNGDQTQIKQYMDIIDSYDKSILGAVNKTTGLENAMFDALSTANVDGKKIVLRNELKVVNNCYHSYVALQEIDSMNLNETLDFNQIENLVNTIFNSDLVGVVADEAMPYFLNKILDEQSSTMDPSIYNFVKGYLSSYGTPKFDILKNDCLAMVKTAKVLQNNNFFDLIQNNNISINDVLNVFQKTSEKNPIYDIFNELLNSSTIQNLLSQSVNLVLDITESQLSNIANKPVTIERVTLSNINWQNEKANISNVFNNLIDIVAVVEPYIKDMNQNVAQITKVMNFEKLGEILTTFQNSELFKKAYDNVCTSLNQIDKINNYIQTSELKNVVWKDEFSHVQQLLKVCDDSGLLDYAINQNGAQVTAEKALELLDKKTTTSDKKYISLFIEELMQSNLIRASMPKMLDTLNTEITKSNPSIVIPKIDISTLNWENETNNLCKVFEGITANYKIMGENPKPAYILKNINMPAFKDIVINITQSNLLKHSFNGAIKIAQNDANISKSINLAFIDDNFVWNTELDQLIIVFDTIQTSDFIDNITATNDTMKNVFTYFDENPKFTESIINDIYSTKLMQYNLEKYINIIEDEFSKTLNIEIEKTKINIADLQKNLAKRKIAFSNSLLNLTWIIKDILNGQTLNIEYINQNHSKIANSLNKIQNSVEFKNTYIGLIKWLSSNKDYGYLITDLLKTKEPYEIQVDWNPILEAVNFLYSKKDNFTDLSALTSTDFKTLMKDISTESKNPNVEKLIKIYLLHDEVNQEKIDVVNNFNFTDYTHFEILINAKDYIDTAKKLLPSDKSSALTQFENALTTLNNLNDNTYLNNATKFLDLYANTNISAMLTNIDFNQEITVITSLKEFINIQSIKIADTEKLIANLTTSKLVLDQLAESDIKLIDMNSQTVLDGFKDEVANSLGVPAQAVDNADIQNYVKDIIKKKTSDTIIQNKIAHLINLTM